MTATAVSASATARPRRCRSPSRRAPRRPSATCSTSPSPAARSPTRCIGVTGAGRVLMKPAAAGTGVIAGGAARIILEEAGVHDVLCKSLGSANHINVARATIAGLKSLQRPDEVAKRRGLAAEEFVPKGMLKAYNERQKRRRHGQPTSALVMSDARRHPGQVRRSAPSRRPAARCGPSASAASARPTPCPTAPRSGACSPASRTSCGSRRVDTRQRRADPMRVARPLPGPRVDEDPQARRRVASAARAARPPAAAPRASTPATRSPAASKAARCR